MSLNKTIINIALPQYQVEGLLARQQRWMEVCRVALEDESRAAEHPVIQKKLAVHAEIYKTMRSAYETQGINIKEQDYVHPTPE
ncbi:MAG: hypothetical protein K0U66_07390 [Gammaproteobacteria bacterium]|nr:hypothetical protein [Gammaproteobacteria bacterium]